LDLQSEIKPLSNAELELVLSWRNHEAIKRFMYSQHDITLAEHQAWFQSVNDNPFLHAFVYYRCNTPMGFVSFSQLRKSKVADWGFYMAPDAPRGAGSDMGFVALEHAFTHLDLHKINGQALGFNESSAQFHKKLGFVEEGVLREQYFDGQAYMNVRCFGLLKREWMNGEFRSGRE
jgi:UDP-4-amino-4,6-dideoxy-N-acetyl-beta-L-altrosamine N-acetyltransferase